MTTPATFHHEAVFYEGDDQFVERSLAFLRGGLARSEPALVMVGGRKLELLRAALGSRAADVHLADMEVVGRNPARIIPAWSRFVADNAGSGGGMRGIGEPIWAERTPSELSECQLHESLINLAFAQADDFRLICPYDTAALSDDVIAEARRSHPVVSHEGAEAVSHDYCGIDKVATRFSEPLSEPPAEAEELRVTLAALRVARRIVRARADEAGLGERSEDLSLAVNEVLSNSLQHAGEDGTLRLWQDATGMVCEVRDRGHIMQPLIGREEPGIGQIGGHGMWLVNLVCDLVQVRSSEHGSTVRMRMNRIAR
ncbi:MAG TPA: anti-sigma factor RsbA family regulatory protein [Thermoleophilaceae bacterium]|nr:anti-sigma factor RsbA family regulatory protein [Thermoleophilaceae bacterium]